MTGLRQPTIRGKPPDKVKAPVRGPSTVTTGLADQLLETQGSGPGAKGIKGKALRARFWSKVDRRGERDCWLWTAKHNGRYGYFYLGRRQMVSAHRIAVILTTGRPIPPGMTVHHICRQTLCCNPAHLRIASQAENVMRDASPPAVNAHKTHCIHGHPLSGENVRIRTHRSGEVERVCMSCERRRNRAKAQAQKAVQ